MNILTASHALAGVNVMRPLALSRVERNTLIVEDRRQFGTRRHIAAKVTRTCRRTPRFTTAEAIAYLAEYRAEIVAVGPR